jgi:CRISPR-associated protein Csx10
LQRIGRTAVARERGAVADRLLYALEVITPQIERDELGINGRPLQAEATFHGTMWVVSAEAERWCEWLADVHHLGGARSRGLGRVEVTATVHQNGVAVALERQIQQTLWQLHDGTSRPATTHPPDMTLTDRILTFNREAYDLGVNDAFWYFTVDLESAMILGGVRGPRFRLEPGDLGLPAQVALVRGWARYGEAGGWSTAWGLPKPVAPALVAGSTFLFKAPRQDEALIQQILERCVFLERKGIGQRRDEGYGWVKICTPFHLKKEAAK